MKQNQTILIILSLVAIFLIGNQTGLFTSYSYDYTQSFIWDGISFEAISSQPFESQTILGWRNTITPGSSLTLETYKGFSGKNFGPPMRTIVETTDLNLDLSSIDRLELDGQYISGIFWDSGFSANKEGWIVITLFSGSTEYRLFRQSIGEINNEERVAFDIVLERSSGGWITSDSQDTFIQEYVINENNLYNLRFDYEVSSTSAGEINEYRKIILNDIILGTSQEQCVENDIIQTEGNYYICRNGHFQLILDLVELSEAEQQAFLNEINLLQLTVDEKAQLINDLTTTLEGQIILINELESTVLEKAQIIDSLNLNIQEQTQLISEMELTVQQQGIIIAELTNSITEQAAMINQLNINLQQKAQLVDQLQAENEAQAELIRLMELSFGDQAAIINALNNEIEEDAVIIQNLGLSLDEQADLITELDLTVQQQAQLIEEFELSISQQLVLIGELELSLQEEQDLVAQLQLTIDEQNQLIEDLKNYQPTETPTTTFDLQQFWNDYQVWIILIGGILFLLIILKK